MKDNSFVIRKAVLNDLEELTQLRFLQQHDDWGADYEDIDNNFYNRTFVAFKNFMKNGLGVIFIAEKDNKIVATCGLQEINVIPQCNDKGKCGFIFNVFTREEYRQQGIQSALLKEAVSYAKQAGIDEIGLETDNDIAIALYKKYGFKNNNLMMVMNVMN